LRGHRCSHFLSRIGIRRCLTRFSEPPEAETGLPSVFALGFLANQSGAVFGLLDRLFTDPATVQVEAIVATAGAESIARIGYRRRQLGTATRVAAIMPRLLGKFSQCFSPNEKAPAFWPGSDWNGRNEGCSAALRRAVVSQNELQPGSPETTVVAVARSIYRGRVEQFSRRLIMLCDRARVLARSDRPETMP
jgi:hypothetical protein